LFTRRCSLDILPAAMTPTTSLALVVSALLLQAIPPASGEIFHLDKRPIPPAYSLQGLAAFTVYVPPDGPTAQAGGSPFVEFKGVQAHSTDPTMADDALAHYGSVQLSLISVDDYDQHISKGPVCDLNGQLSNEGASMSKYNVGFTHTQFVHSDINKTGVYFLLMSNCGNFSQGEVIGQVVVRNTFGFMSAIQYHKLSFYSYCTMVYTVLAVIWGLLCVTWRQGLIAMHGLVGFVIGLKVVECVFWTGHLYSLNLSGEASGIVACLPIMFTVVSSYSSYTLILVISQGWRMTEEVLQECTVAKIGVFGLIWISFNYLREGAMVHRQSFHISSNFMTMTALGAMTTNGILFAWILMSLAKLSNGLKERNLENQLKAVSRFTVAFIVAIVASFPVAVVQLLDSLGSLAVPWKYQYLADGGLVHVIVASMVVVAMWVWKPSADSDQLGYDAAPIGQNDDEGLWKEDGDDEDAEENGGNKIAPATVGAADEDL